MTKALLSVLLCLAGPALAANDNDSPLALTGLASAQGPVSPTAADQAQSQQYLAKGMDCLRLGHANAAVQALLDAVRLAPDADNTKALGTAYYQVGNLPKAAWAYQQSLQWRPDGRVQSLLDQLKPHGAAPAACGVPAAPTAAAAPESAPRAAEAPKPEDGGRTKTPEPRGNEAPK
jgi:hypothetical protein